jgi:hypothetical protein
MDGRRVVQRLVNGESALEIARSFGYRSPTPVMDAARDLWSITSSGGMVPWLGLPLAPAAWSVDRRWFLAARRCQRRLSGRPVAAATDPSGNNYAASLYG